MDWLVSFTFYLTTSQCQASMTSYSQAANHDVRAEHNSFNAVCRESNKAHNENDFLSNFTFIRFFSVLWTKLSMTSNLLTTPLGSPSRNDKSCWHLKRNNFSSRWIVLKQQFSWSAKSKKTTINPDTSVQLGVFSSSFLAQSSGTLSQSEFKPEASCCAR